MTHTVGDLVKHIAFCVMMILFVGYIWLPGGIILACVELVLIPFLWLTFRVVKNMERKEQGQRRDGQQHCRICNRNTDFPRLWCGRHKNKTVTSDMKRFSDVSYDYENTGFPQMLFNVFSFGWGFRLW